VKFLAALEFLTIIPLPRHHETSLEEIESSIMFFPVVGLIIGLILAGLSWLLELVLPAALANALLMVALVVITGALHLDGFIDTCDGIAGHKTVEERWQIMHDSRSGAFGIVGAVLLLLIKYVSLNSLPEDFLLPTLVLMPVVSRWSMVYAVFAYPYARPVGLGGIYKEGASGRRFIIASVFTLVIGAGVAFFGLSYLGVLIIWSGVWILVALIAAYFIRKFAGLTGDTYGAINEVAEVMVLILACLIAFD
jgi:adenosylcobinamide-GDP ribazoletransferase